MEKHWTPSRKLLEMDSVIGSCGEMESWGGGEGGGGWAIHISV